MDPLFFCMHLFSSDPPALFQKPFKLCPLSCSPHPSHLLPSLKSPRLPRRSLLVNPSVASLPYVTPCSPDSANYWGVSAWSRHSGAAVLSESKTLLPSRFLATHADMKLRGCGTLEGCHASSFVLLQPPGTDLTQLAIL